VLCAGKGVCDAPELKAHCVRETQEGLGIWKGGYKGAMGDKGD
jgi:hypothetical protein